LHQPDLQALMQQLTAFDGPTTT